MKVIYLKLATVLALLVIFTACGSSSDSGNSSPVTIKVNQQTQARKSFGKSPAALASLSALRITVSATDYHHVYPDVPLTGGSTVQSTILVPNGLQRTFLVQVLDGGGLPAYFGSTTADLNGSPIGLAVDASNPFYTVAYAGNGNSGGSTPVDQNRYLPTQTFTVLDNTGVLVKSGYSFAGWNTRADGSGTTYTQGQVLTIGKANITLYAAWTANPTYTVTYDGNGATSGAVPIDATNYLPGQTFTVQENSSNLGRSGYAFTGWNSQADGTGTSYSPGQSFTMGAADLTLYAAWSANPTYSVTYDGNGATSGALPVDATKYQPGQAATVRGNTGNLGRSGYSFTGWNTQADSFGTAYAPAQTFTMGAANLTLYAMWSANPTYSVTYDGNGYTRGFAPVDATKYQQGQTVTALENTGFLEMGGHSFTGWNTRTNGGGTTYAPGQTFTMDAANVTLYAVWVMTTPPPPATYTVTYDDNGATGGTVPVDPNSYQAGQTVTVLDNPGNLVDVPGIVFDGWNTQPDGTGINYNSSWNPSSGSTFTMGPANVTLYAIWYVT